MRRVPSPLNLAFLKVQRRAEQGDPAVLVQTFVDVGSLFTLLSTRDHQILYGRRGTGKTHALHYLAAQVTDNGDVAAYIDLRSIGSAGGIYGDPSLPLAERGTRLLSDVLSQLIDRLQGYVLEHADSFDLTAAMRTLDRLDEAAVDVRVTGEAEVEETSGERDVSKKGVDLKAKVDATGMPAAEAAYSASRESERQGARRAKVTGIERHHVQFGQVATYLQKLVEALPAERLWILLDEWVAIPAELQPLLADLLRRAVLPVPGVTVKVAAIEQRSNFRAEKDGDYLGFELGADIQADLDLDDFMVFENDAEKAKEFFRDLLFRHITALMDEDPELGGLATAMELQRAAFTQRNAIDDFVRAAEGVPRDAINILRLAATRANEDPIAVEHVRVAARRWYLQNKEKEVPEDAKALLHWIIDEVIGKRQARAFLLQQGESGHELISALYDARVLHVIRRGVAAQDRAGVRFDVYAIDYGCYVELINTARAPQGLYQVGTDEEGEWVEVPHGDYRSIRRAILDLQEFARRPAQLALTTDS